MGRIEKFLRKLPRHLRRRVLAAYYAILKNQLETLDIKPLQGKKDWFRCRVGDIRIIFIRTTQGTHVIYDVQFRGKAYRRV